MSLYFENQTNITLDDVITADVEAAFAAYLAQEGIPERAEVDITFVDDEAIRSLNRDYRDKDSATDVLSFPLYERAAEIDPAEPEIMLGDIVVSLPHAMMQAETYGHSLEREVLYLIVHGLLHLAGYDHMQPGERSAMRAHEERILARLGILR